MAKERIPRSTSDEFCQKLKPQAKPIYLRDSRIKGSLFRVMPTGSKSWIFCYAAPCPKKKRREQRKGLGSFRYGRFTALSVPVARREAKHMKNEVRFEGADSIEDRRQQPPSLISHHAQPRKGNRDLQIEIDEPITGCAFLWG